MRTDRRLTAVALLCAMAAASCTSSEEATRPENLPQPTPELSVVMREYAYKLDGVVPVGEVVFRFSNVGAEEHTPVLVELPEEAAPIGQYLLQAGRPAVRGFANLFAQSPGMATGAFAVDLQAGHRYALICLSKAPDGHLHFEKGMTWETRAEAISPSAPAGRP